MSSNIKDRPTRVAESDFYWSQDSLSFARSVLSDLEHQLKQKAKELTLSSGRNLVTEEDMRLAVDEILGLEEGEVSEPGGIGA